MLRKGTECSQHAEYRLKRLMKEPPVMGVLRGKKALVDFYGFGWSISAAVLVVKKWFDVRFIFAFWNCCQRIVQSQKIAIAT